MALAIPRQPNGDPILPGRVKHEKVWDFGFATTVPTELVLSNTTGTSGSATITGNGGAKRLKLAAPLAATTGDTGNKIARITFPDSILLSDVESVTMTLEGISWPRDQSPAAFNLLLEGGTADGGSLEFVLGRLRQKNPTLTTLGFYFDPFGGPTTTGQVKRFDMSFMLMPRRKASYMFIGDQVVAAAHFPTMGTGAITPAIVFGRQGQGEQATWLEISKLRITTTVD